MKIYIFIIFIILFYSISYAKSDNDHVRFYTNYAQVNTTIFGNTGKFNDLMLIQKITNEHLLSSPFGDFWDEIVSFECVNKLGGIENLRKNYNEFTKDMFDACYRKYIVDNFNLINTSINLYLKYLNSDEFNKNISERKKSLKK